jgi:hypothetical protein
MVWLARGGKGMMDPAQSTCCGGCGWRLQQMQRGVRSHFLKPYCSGEPVQLSTGAPESEHTNKQHIALILYAYQPRRQFH